MQQRRSDNTPVGGGAHWPLTGRESELTWAIKALRTDGGVVLSGPAGVGRSRLAREILRDAGRCGRSGLWVGATAAARGIPFGAFAVLLGGSDGSAEVRSLAHAAAALREEVEVLVVDDAPARRGVGSVAAYLGYRTFDGFGGDRPGR